MLRWKRDLSMASAFTLWVLIDIGHYQPDRLPNNSAIRWEINVDPSD
jgi:hypothetical protein